MKDNAAPKPFTCEGTCWEYADSGHSGEVKEVYVVGWGYFHYCEEAIREDIRRGLKVITCEEGEE